jgi:hypothetical protein
MITAVSLLALGFALTAQAGPRLYDGSIIVVGFGNDTTIGTTVPFTLNTPGVVPFGLKCATQPFHTKETKTLGTYYNTNTQNFGNGNYNSFTVPAYGGQDGIHSAGSITAADGCPSPGQPLTGKATIHTTGTSTTSRASTNPRAFTLLKSQMAVVTTGASSTYAFPIVWNIQYADLRNDRGYFKEDGGPGRFATPTHNRAQWSHSEAKDDGGPGTLRVLPGDHKFGGTMRLLGTVYDNEGYKSKYDTYVAKYTWLFQYIGGPVNTSAGNLTAPYVATKHNSYIGRFGGFTGTTTVKAYALSWTTGTASVTGVGGAFSTIMARAGFDNRSEYGGGDIQMVSPMLTRWIFQGGSSSYFNGGIGIMRLKVAPEPHEWMLLGAGLSMLGLLYRANRRSR